MHWIALASICLTAVADEKIVPTGAHAKWQKTGQVVDAIASSGSLAGLSQPNRRVIDRCMFDCTLKALARLFLTFNLAAAFHPSGLSSGRLWSPLCNSPLTGLGRLVLDARNSINLPVPVMSSSAELTPTNDTNRLKVHTFDFSRRAVATIGAIAIAVPLSLSTALAITPPVVSQAPAVANADPVVKPAVGMAAPKGSLLRRKTSFVTPAVEAVSPAVVRINTERVETGGGFDPFAQEGDGGRLVEGQGSGVIVGKDGLIMTNAHVVDNADKVTVTLPDGRIFEGTVKGADDFIDLAAVKIRPTGRPLPFAPLGRSDDLEVGDFVIAIGNSVGLDNTVTLGIVSSLSRSAADVGLQNRKVDFIQTDAAINPGNSGGPLLNEFGEVVGINTAIRANAAGIGFAIPIDKASKALAILSQGRSIPHPYLGMSLTSLTVELAQENNKDPNSDIRLPETEGALVLGISPEGPAAKAGFRKFDVVQSVGERSVKQAVDLTSTVDESKVGQPLTCKVIRGQQTLSLDVAPGDLSELLALEKKKAR